MGAVGTNSLRKKSKNEDKFATPGLSALAPDPRNERRGEEGIFFNGPASIFPLQLFAGNVHMHSSLPGTQTQFGKEIDNEQSRPAQSDDGPLA